MNSTPQPSQDCHAAHQKTSIHTSESRACVSGDASHRSASRHRFAAFSFISFSSDSILPGILLLVILLRVV